VEYNATKKLFSHIPSTLHNIFCWNKFLREMQYIVNIWYIDVPTISQQTALEIKNLNYLICFIVPHWWGTIAQNLGYSETHYSLIIKSYLLFDSHFVRPRHRTKDFWTSKGSFSIENVMKFKNANRLFQKHKSTRLESYISSVRRLFRTMWK
jgi:hypothetical protein